MPDNSRCRAWAYVGSANLSESAWYVATWKSLNVPNGYHRGRLVQDRTTKKPKLNCRNWECGVLVPVIDKEQDPAASSAKTRSLNDNAEANTKPTESANTLDIFQGTVPVPMQFPARRFGPDLKPWYFTF